jgi:hypothetical protein
MVRHSDPSNALARNRIHLGWGDQMARRTQISLEKHVSHHFTPGCRWQFGSCTSDELDPNIEFRNSLEPGRRAEEAYLGSEVPQFTYMEVAMSYTYQPVQRGVHVSGSAHLTDWDDRSEFDMSSLASVRSAVTAPSVNHS